MDIAVVEQTSEQFLGKWKRLVSTTNWEKGQIISQWRAALVDAGAGVSEYSDEVWSRQVGQVTPQHVGRLRRVFERFGDTRDSYAGLYWSHFQAALDWDDAEMWLEGAVQNSWSIADMRRTRSETLGTPADWQSTEDETGAELDEDGELAGETLPAVEPSIDLVRSTERSQSGDATDAIGRPQSGTMSDDTTATTSMPARVRGSGTTSGPAGPWRVEPVQTVCPSGLVAGRRERSLRGVQAVHREASAGRLGRDRPGRHAGRTQCAACLGTGRGRRVDNAATGTGLDAATASR